MPKYCTVLTVLIATTVMPALYAAQRGAPAPVALTVTLPNPSQKLLHAHEVMPVEAGPLTLYYPKYIPGDHGPSGPIGKVMGIMFKVNGKPIPWHRDAVDMYAFHLDIPKGAHTLDIQLDFPATARITPHLLDLNWNQVVLYRAGFPSKALVYKPTLVIPKSWHYASALELRQRQGKRIIFKPVSLNNLVDSPVIAGEYFRQIDLAPRAPVHRYLDLVADGPGALDISTEQISAYRSLIQQAQALFESHHYRDYHLLLVLSDHTSHGGLEHHQSSDDRARTGTRMFKHPADFMLDASLLPHEYMHSWNGKFRRPAGLWQPNFEQPEKTRMLWVYEGLTAYLGDMLTVRSGLWTKKTYREALAYRAAVMEHRRGRQWRPLIDTTTAAQLLYGAPSAWANWRRTTDFYREGELIWLAVDTKIRALSHDRRSLDDFCRRFFSMDNGSYQTKTYTFADLIAALKKVQPYDWAKFLRTRIDRIGRGAPLSGLERSGWQLVYTDERSKYEKALEDVGSGELSSPGVNMMFSIGLFLNKKGEVKDVLWHGPAFKTGLAPDMKLIAVNGSNYSSKVLRQAVRRAKDTQKLLKLRARVDGIIRMYTINYHNGLKYPHLVRVSKQTNYLSEILEPKTQ